MVGRDRYRIVTFRMRGPHRALAAGGVALLLLTGACAPAARATAEGRPSAWSRSDVAVRTVASVAYEDLRADMLDAKSIAAHTPRSEDRSFRSAALGRTMPYQVYLPPGYAGSERRYPVLYMLHGMGGSYEEWRALGLFEAADRMIRTGELEPLVIVLPQGDRGYWVDHAGGGEAWGTYTARDLVAEIDGRFRTIAERSRRAIGGLSMGAHGALQLALNNPDTFGIVGAHSLVLRRFGSAPAYFGGPAEYAKRDPMTMVRSKSDVARSVSLWIDIGDRDPWAPLAKQFDGELEQLRIPRQMRVAAGDHSAAYWQRNLADYLRYYDRSLAPARESVLR